MDLERVVGVIVGLSVLLGVAVIFTALGGNVRLMSIATIAHAVSLIVALLLMFTNS